MSTAILTTVPKFMSVEKTNAQLALRTIPASVKIETEKNGLRIKTNPVCLEIDNRAFFDSIGLESNETFLDEYVQDGKDAAMEATEEYAWEGRMMVGPHAMSVADIAYARANRTIDGMIEMIPIAKPEMKWSGGDVEIEYTPDDLHMEWNAGGVTAQYTPYSINYSVGEWKKI